MKAKQVLLVGPERGGPPTPGTGAGQDCRVEISRCPDLKAAREVIRSHRVDLVVLAREAAGDEDCPGGLGGIPSVRLEGEAEALMELIGQPARRGGGPRPGAEGELHLLLVEDNPIDVTIFQAYFIDLNPGFTFEVAPDVSTARRHIAGGGFDLVVSDFFLPDGDGWDVLQAALAAGLPVVVTTSDGNEQLAVDLLKAGAADYIAKDDNYAQHLKLLPATIANVMARAAAERENRLLARSLERRSQEVKELTYFASHDLRAPLRRISMAIDHLDRTYRGNMEAKVGEFFDLIGRATRRMENLTEAILNYADVGESPTGVEFDCHTLVQEVLEDLAPDLESAGAVITLEPLPTVKADPAGFQLLFQNLIGNALKFRREGTPLRVGVSAREEGSGWRFGVEDNGIGIRAADRQRVFGMFQRLHGEDRFVGSGLGLAHCKKIVERHGGEIGVDSVPGQGSTFFFTLPG